MTAEPSSLLILAELNLWLNISTEILRETDGTGDLPIVRQYMEAASAVWDRECIFKYIEITI